MRISAEIRLEVEVNDFVAAAEHQQRLEAILASLKAEFPTAEMEIRERRRRRPELGQRAPRPAPATGAVVGYKDR